MRLPFLSTHRFSTTFPGSCCFWQYGHWTGGPLPAETSAHSFSSSSAMVFNFIVPGM